jgi:NAD(P)-dependent dehydrogenase (short-subunit alcohol dehydrogenase family)
MYREKGCELTALAICSGNSGIGLETVKALAFAGCRVLLCSRDVQAGKAAVVHSVQRAGDSGYAVTDPDVSVLPLDLADLESVEALADAVRRSV